MNVKMLVFIICLDEIIYLLLYDLLLLHDCTFKANDNFFAEAINFYFNKSLENVKFPNCLKLANITPVF